MEKDLLWITDIAWNRKEMHKIMTVPYPYLFCLCLVGREEIQEAMRRIGRKMVGKKVGIFLVVWRNNLPPHFQEGPQAGRDL